MSKKPVGIIERYQTYLPPIPEDCIISLNEGNTPLIRADALSQELEQQHLTIYYKFEGLNPTGSFKDRGMTLAISKAVECHEPAVICASTGNTSASAAAYCARAKIPCYVIIPQQHVAKGKLLQAYRYGAIVIMAKGNFDQALTLAREAHEQGIAALVNSLNPFRIEGQKTAAFEIIDDLGEAPDYHLLPVGNAGNITAYWKGYKEYHQAGKSGKLPNMIGIQAEGAAPLVHHRKIDHPETIASAIRIGDPANKESAIKAKNESRGHIDMVTDKEIMCAYRFIAQREGIFAEPASAAAVAGCIKLARQGFFRKYTTITITLTGSGLKDLDAACSAEDAPSIIEPNIDSLQEVMDIRKRDS